MEYEGQARPFSDMLEFDAEKSVELVDPDDHRGSEEYLRLEAPMTAAPAPTMASSSAPAATSGGDLVVAPAAAAEPVASPEPAEKMETP